MASYAGGLSRSLRQSGDSTTIVVGTAARITARDNLLGEAQLHDARHSLKRPVADVIRRARYWTLGDPLGATAQRLPVGNHLRYHESIGNLTPADVYFGHSQTILLERERIKRDTIKTRRLQHRGKAA